MPEKSEYLSTGFAVFNNHINDADRKAREALGRMMPEWLKKVEMVERQEGGIMAVMEHPSSPACVAYVTLVTYLVNEDT